MKTAADFARAATQIAKLADEMKPEGDDRYANAQNVAIFHMRTAARRAREISEALAQKEATK